MAAYPATFKLRAVYKYIHHNTARFYCIVTMLPFVECSTPLDRVMLGLSTAKEFQKATKSLCICKDLACRCIEDDTYRWNRPLESFPFCGIGLPVDLARVHFDCFSLTRASTQSSPGGSTNLYRTFELRYSEHGKEERIPWNYQEAGWRSMCGRCTGSFGGMQGVSRPIRQRVRQV